MDINSNVFKLLTSGDKKEVIDSIKKLIINRVEKDLEESSEYLIDINDITNEIIDILKEDIINEIKDIYKDKILKKLEKQIKEII